MTLDGRVSGSDVQTPFSEYLPDKSATDSICGANLGYFPFKNVHTIRWIIWGPENGDQPTCKESIYVSVFPGVLQLKSVKPGHTVIKGQLSSLFLCVDGGGRLRGQVQSKENYNILKYPSFLSFTGSSHMSSLSEPLHRGWLHLQRTAAGRWIHPFPFLTPWTPCVSGIKTFPRPTCSPLHSIPAT